MPNRIDVKGLPMEDVKAISTDLPLLRNVKKPAQEKVRKVCERGSFYCWIILSKVITMSADCVCFGKYSWFTAASFSDVVAVEKSASQTSTGKSSIPIPTFSKEHCCLYNLVLILCASLTFCDILNLLFLAKCSLKQDSGPCNEKIQRWYFNAQKKKCEQFIYGGCKGNLNRFITAETCMKTCLPTGTCNSSIQLYDKQYFCWPLDLVSVPFDLTTVDLQYFCDVCFLPLCRCTWLEAAKFSWWLVFWFSSFWRCSAKNESLLDSGLPLVYCGTWWLLSWIQGVCYLKKDSGPCDQKIEKWFFNRRTNKCEKFTYGGCKGNLNRFATAEKCRLTCKRNADKGK